MCLEARSSTGRRTEGMDGSLGRQNEAQNSNTNIKLDMLKEIENMMIFDIFLGSVVCLLGVLADEWTTQNGLRHKTKQRGSLEAALEIEENEGVVKLYRKNGLEWGWWWAEFFLKKSIIVIAVALFLFLYYQTQIYGMIFIANIFFGVAINNLIRTYISIGKSYFGIVLISIPLAILAVLLSWLGTSFSILPANNLCMYGLPFGPLVYGTIFWLKRKFFPTRNPTP